MKAFPRTALRTRLALQMSVFGLGVLLLVTFVIYLMLRYEEQRLVYRLAEQRADQVLLAWQEGRSPAEIPGVDSSDRVSPKQAADSGIPNNPAALSPGHYLLPRGDEVEHVVVREVNGLRIQASYLDGPHRQRIQRIGSMLLILVVMLGVMVAVVASAWAQALIAVRPALARRLARKGSATLPAAQSAGDDRQSAGRHHENQWMSRNVQQREREFIANVGHELRTPITLVATGCELLMESPRLNKREREHLYNISQAVEHMSETVRSFLLLARDGEFGDVELVELRQTVLDAVARHRQDLQARGIRLQINIGAEAAIMANREAVFVVVSNLIRNAVKYTDHGSIAIHYIGRTMSVADTGCGIADADLANIFMPFFRSRTVAERGHAGIGLGLTIVKRICDFYKWPIRVQSTEGNGTTIAVELNDASGIFR